MLELRPNCECCDKDLPPSADDARICSYECTFCEDCVIDILENVCPNCGGGFTPRPIRPFVDRRPGTSVLYQKASTERVISDYSTDEMSDFAQDVKHIAVDER